MGPNMVFFGWGQVRAGRERMAGDLFNEFVQYLGGQQQQGTAQSFQIVFLDPHGGDLGGFFLIHGETAKLDAMLNTDEWIAYLIRAGMCLDNTGVVRGATGDLVMERMQTWTAAIPA